MVLDIISDGILAASHLEAVIWNYWNHLGTAILTWIK